MTSKLNNARNCTVIKTSQPKRFTIHMQCQHKKCLTDLPNSLRRIIMPKEESISSFWCERARRFSNCLNWCIYFWNFTIQFLWRTGTMRNILAMCSNGIDQHLSEVATDKGGYLWLWATSLTLVMFSLRLPSVCEVDLSCAPVGGKWENVEFSFPPIPISHSHFYSHKTSLAIPIPMMGFPWDSDLDREFW